MKPINLTKVFQKEIRVCCNEMLKFNIMLKKETYHPKRKELLNRIDYLKKRIDFAVLKLNDII